MSENYDLIILNKNIKFLNKIPLTHYQKTIKQKINNQYLVENTIPLLFSENQLKKCQFIKKQYSQNRLKKVSILYVKCKFLMGN